ncbi:bifunctional nuclease family protein [Membranicola marinus]|uniref:Bifunctional nuclease family protein n=1 Tax=Membranihabitans marinus TaxID=1227546 RepID=A0A953HSV1_9BACT|nr:bifunctional nuclease family protein [Membranihabitans marinus]MBY5957288.1 bifunctional nuclease family protein [Membranihabitans marinus]
MKKIELDIIALSHSVTQSNNYAVVLGEQEGVRRLPIVIGGFEAQAIAVAMERMSPTRPLTHDLFKNTLNIFEIDLKEIIINDLLDGVFYAKLICQHDNKLIEVDSRTSDALALAVRFNCPVFTYEFILESAGVILEGDEESKKTAPPPKKGKRKGLESYSVDTLNKMLEEAIQKEDYEKAAKIRDEMARRSKDS